MKRRQLLIGGGTVATAALAGCIGSAQTNSSGESRTLTVSKSGEATAAPDKAVVHVSIEATGDSASAVRTDLSAGSTALNDGLIAAGIPEDDITTGQFNIYERREQTRIPEGGETGSDGEPQETTRYEGTHSFRIEVGDVESVGSVVDTAVDSGADTVSHIEFTLSEDRRAELREEALDSAIQAAREESEYVAGEVDQSVVGVKSVDTSGGDISPVSRQYDTAEAADSRSTELQPDDVTVRATARITYRIE
ncbi:MAG: SIMPL domain-containing protein [Euryarchaeota archaeon]|nr:SIMPL domain-containing protein [Euryarchaeota archaeon]